MKIKLTHNSKRKVTKKFEVKVAENVQIVQKNSSKGILTKKVLNQNKVTNKCSKICSMKKLKNQNSKKF